MSRCRRCKASKWKGDPCPNADCAVNLSVTVRIKPVTRPITATAKHGFHAGNTMGFAQFAADYDAPIRAKGWRTAR